MTDIATHPSAIETLPQQGLYEGLVAEYNNLSDAHTQHIAAKVEASAVPEVTNIDRPSWNGGIGFGKTSYTFSRIQHRIIAEAAAAAGARTAIAEQLDKEEGSQVAWENTENGQVYIRYSDEDGSLRSNIEKVRDRLNLPFKKLADELRAGEQEVITDEQFTLDDDSQDIVINFMGLDPKQETPAKTKAGFMKRLYSLPVHLPGEDIPDGESKQGVYFDEDGALVKILKETDEKAGVYHGMYFEEGTKQDPTDTSFRLGIEIDKSRSRLQRAYASENLAEPFIQTETAKAIAGVLSSSGLVPSARMKEILLERIGSYYSPRHGNSYAELTREAAKFVNLRNRDISELFDGDPEDVEAAFSEMALDDVENEPARVFMGLLKQALAPDRQAEETDLPVYEGKVQIRENNCKDFEAAYKTERGSSYIKHVAGRGGEPTALQVFGPIAVNLQPVLFQGVNIPAGGLFQVVKNTESTDEFTFARMSSLAFDAADSQDAFTWQYMETVTNAGHVNRNMLQRV